MQFTRLGNTGLAVSRLAFGNMTFGTDARFPSVAKVDLATARSMIHRAFDAGVNFVDTADGYSNGEAEKYLGEFLGKKRKEVVVATKCGFRSGKPITQAGLSRRHILEACESSLKKLNTDWIDLYIVHKVDAFTPVEETLEDPERPGALREDPLHRIFQLAGMESGHGSHTAARARVGTIHERPDVLLATRARRGARVCSLPSRYGNRHDRLEPALQRLSQRQIHPGNL